MTQAWTGELIWVQQTNQVSLVVKVSPQTWRLLPKPVRTAQVSSRPLPVVQQVPTGRLLYRHTVSLWTENQTLHAGPVFAVLAGAGPDGFIGSRMDFRDLIHTAAVRNAFLYVVPTNHVTEQGMWKGYVRLGFKKWIAIPCPQPEAMYNRIPNRNLERTTHALTAQRILHRLRIPIFNPSYFNKATLYRIITTAGLQRFLPDTSELTDSRGIMPALTRNGSIYLKPAGGSIGHGIIRIDKRGPMYALRVQKNHQCQTFNARSDKELLSLLERHRLRGKYVIQAAVPLLEWKGRPCDFRVLLQKSQGDWNVVGKGVRVAGPNTITTHVPNGGFIASASEVLQGQFEAEAQQVNEAIDDMVLRYARAIDGHYGDQVGEMSMDIGVDKGGQPWFFEANAKPMKFDEPDIRLKSLQGVLSYLQELRHRSLASKMRGR